MLRYFKGKACILQFVTAIAALVLLSACNDKPTDVGISFIADTVGVHSLSSDDSTLILSAEDYFTSTSIINAGRLFVGKNGSVSAISIIRFGDIPDTMNYVKESDIESATLYIYPTRYATGDTTGGKMSFKIKKVAGAWTEKAEWDSLFVPGFMESATLGSFSDAIKLKDTRPVIGISLDKKLIPEWLKQRPDTAAHVVNYGIALVPDESSTIINSFSADAIGSSGSSTKSFIKVIFHNTRKNARDTMTFTSAIDASFISKPTNTAGYINVQAGTSIYSILRFDVSCIPQFSGIHKAELEMTVAPEKCKFGNFGIDGTVRLDLVTTPADSVPINYYFAGPSTADTLKYYVPSIASSVEYWTRHGGKGMLLVKPADFTQGYKQLDKMVFYGPSYPDKSKRPRLKIIYSKQMRQNEK